jgi:hypothetical protein
MMSLERTRRIRAFGAKTSFKVCGLIKARFDQVSILNQSSSMTEEAADNDYELEHVSEDVPDSDFDVRHLQL